MSRNMPGLIIDGRIEAGPDVPILNYKDHPELKLVPGHSMRARNTRHIQMVVAHNTKNIPLSVRSGAGRYSAIGERVTRFWTTNPAPAGAHIVVDHDGTITCHADLLQDAAYHAGTLNERSIGIEIYEDSDGTVYEVQIENTIKLIDWLCVRFGIQRQFPGDGGVVKRLAGGGRDCYGVIGHCHNNPHKKYDPSIVFFQYLKEAGYQEFCFAAEDDKAYWREFQIEHQLAVDGIPGPETCDVIQAIVGFAGGVLL
jgi:hypothetical protein